MIIEKRLKVFTVLVCVFSAIIFILNSCRLVVFQDEMSFLNNVLYFSLTKNIVPIYAQYPTFFSYLTAIPIYGCYLIFYVWHGGAVEWLANKSFFTIFFLEHQLIWLWVARSVVLVFSILTILLTLRTAFRYYGIRTAVWAGLILILDPWGRYMALSGYGLPDIPMTFFATVVLALSFVYLDNKNIRLLYGAGFICGLAASCKLNGIFAICPLIAACLLGERKVTVNLVTIIFACILGFIAGSPAFLTAPGVYQHGFLIEKEILVGQQYSVPAGSWLWVIRWLWQHNVLFTIVLFFTVGYSFMRRTKKDIVFLSLVIPVFLVISALKKMNINYCLLLYPASALFMGRFLSDMADTIKINSYRKFAPVFISLLLVSVLTWGLCFRLSDNLRPSNISLAKSWVATQVSGLRVVDLCKSILLSGDDILRILGSSTSPQDQWFCRYYQKYRYPLDRNENRSRDKKDDHYLILMNKEGAWLIPFNEVLALNPSRPGDAVLLRNQGLFEEIFFKINTSLVKDVSSGSGPSVRIYEAGK